MRILISFVVLNFIIAAIGTLSLQAAKISAVKVGSKINVAIDGKYFTSYIFASDEKYPFFYPVNGSLSGGSVTSMRNGEYPHHSSLFFGCDQVNGEGAKGEKDTFGKPSPWIDFYGKRGEFTEGLAILQHPSNPWYPSPWFTRDYGFISPTPMYWPENGTENFLKKGETLQLRYRVLVHGGSSEEAKIGELFEKYKKEN